MSTHDITQFHGSATTSKQGSVNLYTVHNAGEKPNLKDVGLISK